MHPFVSCFALMVEALMAQGHASIQQSLTASLARKLVVARLISSAGCFAPTGDTDAVCKCFWGQVQERGQAAGQAQDLPRSLGPAL